LNIAAFETFSQSGQFTKENAMKRVLFSAAVAAAIGVAAIAGSVTSASAAPHGFSGGRGGGMSFSHPSGGMSFNRPSGGMSFNRPNGMTFNRPAATFNRPATTFNRRGPTFNRTAQAWNPNWNHRRHRFFRGAFVGFAAAGYPWWDSGYYDSCWVRQLTPYGWTWVNTCDPYYSYYPY
jgi:hypothetical protein